MKFLGHICLVAIFISSLLPVFLSAELKRNPEVRYGSIQEYRNRQALLEGSKSSFSQSPVSKSDLGLQRPVETKETGFNYYFGFESKISHSNNPASSPDSSSLIDSAGIWDNSLNNNFVLGAYDLGGASFSPILSLSLNNSKYFGDKALKILDSSSLNISFTGIFQFANDWSARAGMASSLDYDRSMIQTYQQTSPTIGLSKGFKISQATSFVDFSLSYHFTDTQYQGDKMNRFESALIWGVVIPIGDFEISPYLRFSYGNYENQDRNEFTTNVGSEFAYYFYEWIAAKFILSYTNRGANGQDGVNADFSKFDLGGSLAIQAQF